MRRQGKEATNCLLPTANFSTGRMLGTFPPASPRISSICTPCVQAARLLSPQSNAFQWKDPGLGHELFPEHIFLHFIHLPQILRVFYVPVPLSY